MVLVKGKFKFKFFFFFNLQTKRKFSTQFIIWLGRQIRHLSWLKINEQQINRGANLLFIVIYIQTDFQKPCKTLAIHRILFYFILWIFRCFLKSKQSTHKLGANSQYENVNLTFLFHVYYDIANEIIIHKHIFIHLKPLVLLTFSNI